MDDDARLLGETLVVKATHDVVVGYVAQVDYHHGHVVVATACLAEQCLDVVPHAVGLTDDVLGVLYLSLVVDAGRARDDDVAAVTVVDGGASLEADAVVAGAVEVGGGVEVMNLSGAEAGNGVVVHLRHDLGSLSTTADAC